MAIDVPRLDGIVIDGRSDDWGDRGFSCGLITRDGRMKPASDLDCGFRLGWDDRGLLVSLNVRDDAFVEADNAGDFYTRDSAQIFVSVPTTGDGHVGCELSISPGMTEKYPELRQNIRPQPSAGEKMPEKLEATIVRTKTDNGYALEALLPWSNLGVTPKQGDTIGVLIVINDADGGDNERFAPRWPGHDQWRRSVRLATARSEPVLALATARFEHFKQARVDVQTVAELLGQSIELRKEGQVLATGTLAMDTKRQRPAATLLVPIAPAGAPYGTLDLFIEGKLRARVDIPDLEEARARQLTLLAPKPSADHFATAEFPQFSFDADSYADDICGQYTLAVNWYDNDMNPVTRADHRGRYGAVVTITYGQDDAKRSTQRFFTLYRAEPDAPPADTADNDRRWWIKVKQKLYGSPALFAEPFICPRPIEGAPAPMLHEGSPAEAGFRADAPETIDRVCRAWADDSDEGFVVCVARHGVIVLHRAYGASRGSTMTLQTTCWFASISKMFSGTIAMELVDQKRFALDDGIDRFVPAFRNVAVKKPLTIRHLFTHTSGLPGDWSRGMSGMDRRAPGNVAVADYRGNIGESMMDMDQRIAGYYPLLKVADHYEYQETDLALARSILELASGEPLTDLYQKHLLGPLGCDSITISDMAGTAHGTAMDLAKLAQMLLNRGAYGDKRFFSEQVFEQMLPQPIGRILGNDEKYEQGIGTQTHGGPGLSSHSFGHRSASETTVRIDPDNDLVIVMVRNAQGKNFDKYHPRFIAAVTDAMDH